MSTSHSLPWHAVVTLSLWLSLSLTAADSGAGHRREAVAARHGAVATDDGRCSEIGRDVLRRGGHAVDAAVAAAFCLGVVGPASSGIGGGAFMVVRQAATGEARAYDMRETAPLLASENMYNGNETLKARGGLSIAVPGELAGLHKVWKRYGKIPWARLVGPAERLASSGFKISPYLHMQLLASQESIFGDRGLRNTFTFNGTILKSGDLCFNKKLAHTLKTISDSGVKAFYNGSLGLSLVRDVRNAGGVITMRDLQRYKVKVTRPISTDVAGLRLLTMPPPSGGPPMILMLNILAGYGLPSGVSGSLGVHRTIEALKHTFAVRMNLGDPKFVNVSKVLSDMLSPKFAEEIRKRINDNRTFNSSHYGAKWNQILDHGTSHLSVVDGRGNAVSMTTTVNAYFGSKIMSPSTGIVLNNEMDDFSIPRNISAGSMPPAPANFIRPGKRPVSSMTPTIVLKGNRVKAVMGASGGAMIFSAVGEVFLNRFVRRMSPLASVMAPRIYHQLVPNVVDYENWTTVIGDHFEVPRDIREALKKKGHALKGLAGGTICQLIVENKNKNFRRQIVAVSDPRKGGFPAGF